MIRQGDLMFIPVDSIPVDAQRVGDGIIARGEASGHAHRLQTGRGRALLMAAGVAYIRVCYRAMITHEEHGAVELPAGDYRVTRQREYEPAGYRQVAD